MSPPSHRPPWASRQPRRAARLGRRGLVWPLACALGAAFAAVVARCTAARALSFAGVKAAHAAALFGIPPPCVGPPRLTRRATEQQQELPDEGAGKAEATASAIARALAASKKVYDASVEKAKINKRAKDEAKTRLDDLNRALDASNELSVNGSKAEQKQAIARSEALRKVLKGAKEDSEAFEQRAADSERLRQQAIACVEAVKQVSEEAVRRNATMASTESLKHELQQECLRSRRLAQTISQISASMSIFASTVAKEAKAGANGIEAVGDAAPPVAPEAGAAPAAPEKKKKKRRRRVNDNEAGADSGSEAVRPESVSAPTVSAASGTSEEKQQLIERVKYLEELLLDVDQEFSALKQQSSEMRENIQEIDEARAASTKRARMLYGAIEQISDIVGSAPMTGILSVFQTEEEREESLIKDTVAAVKSLKKR